MMAKGLTVMQPHAELIASGRKTIETRWWPTNYRGPLAIHAGLRVDRQAFTFIPAPALIALPHPLHWQDNLMRGAIVATTTLADVRRMRPSDEADACCPWDDGKYAWILKDTRRVDPPIARVGAQGLWNINLPESLHAPGT